MSFINYIKPIFNYIPEVEAPAEKPTISKRLLWTLCVIITFVILGQIGLYGLDLTSPSAAYLSQLQIIMASSIGTILTLGIGPIVVGSIILQLLVGSGLLKFDFSNPDERRTFSSLQKIFSIIMAIFEAIIYTRFEMVVALPGYLWVVIVQIVLGSVILIYLDEVVKNYGFGSGISLFIAVGVATEIFWQIFNPISTVYAGLRLFESGASFSLSTGAGYLWLFIATVGSGFYNAFVLNIVPILAALFVFALVVYFEGVHINIPITLGRPGQFGRFPVKFLYVSNMPVILAMALFANIALISYLMKDVTWPIIGTLFLYIQKLTSPPAGILETLLLQGSFTGLWGQIFTALIYSLLLMIVCIVFGLIWVQIANQDSASVARQLQQSGMYLPGFRRDPRVIEGVLDKYIPTITILGSGFVGFLAGFASLAGAIGTGTGILLTVDIVYRFYEELAKEQLSDNAFLNRIMGSIRK